MWCGETPGLRSRAVDHDEVCVVAVDVDLAHTLYIPTLRCSLRAIAVYSADLHGGKARVLPH